MLDPTELRLYKSESDIVRFAQGEGYLQVADNHALVLVEEAHEPGELDTAQLQDRLSRAEDRAARRRGGLGGRAGRPARQTPLEAFLRIAQGGGDAH